MNKVFLLLLLGTILQGCMVKEETTSLLDISLINRTDKNIIIELHDFEMGEQKMVSAGSDTTKLSFSKVTTTGHYILGTGAAVDFPYAWDNFTSVIYIIEDTLSCMQSINFLNNESFPDCYVREDKTTSNMYNLSINYLFNDETELTEPYFQKDYTMLEKFPEYYSE